MANKQTATLSKKSANLCEINREYPLLKRSSTPLRHLNTSEPTKTLDYHNIEKLVNKVIVEHPEKDLNVKHPKPAQEETEIIELFHEEINPKSYRKGRSHLRNKIDDQDY